MDDRPKRRRPRRPHRVTPSPATRPPLAPDDLSAPPGTPPLVLLQPAANLSDDRQRPIRRRQLLLRVHMPVPRLPGSPLCGRLEQRQLRRRQQNDATHDGPRRSNGAGVGRMRPSTDSVATRPRPDPSEPVANRHFLMRARSQFCAGVLPAQREISRSFAIGLQSGGGGNRTRVTFPPPEVYCEVICAWSRGGVASA